MKNDVAHPPIQQGARRGDPTTGSTVYFCLSSFVRFFLCLTLFDLETKQIN